MMTWVAFLGGLKTPSRGVVFQPPIIRELRVWRKCLCTGRVAADGRCRAWATHSRMAGMKSGNHKNSSTARGAAAQRRKPSARPGKVDERRASKSRGAKGGAPAKNELATFDGMKPNRKGGNRSMDARFGKNNLDRLGKPDKPGGPSDASKPNRPNKSNKSGKASKSGKPTKFAKAAPVRRDGGLRAGCARGSVAPGAFFCPIDSKCGGCEWLAVPYAEQLKRKQHEVEGLFDGLLDSETAVRPILGMDDPRYYRNKVVSPYVGIWDKKARQMRVLCGMYERGTHRVIDSGECLLENREAKRIILTIRDLMRRFRIEPYDEDTDEGFLRHVQVRVGHTSGEIMVTVVTREDQFPGAKGFVRALREKHPSITTVVQNVNTRQTNVILGDKERTLFGPGFILDELCGLSFRISSKSFYQVNSTQTEVLYRRAIEMAKLAGTEVLMDAYCGTGTIGLVAARGVDGNPGAARVIGVEERPDAVADARNNARHNGIKRAEFVAADAGEYMHRMADEGAPLDVLMMDPPRAGSTPEFLKAACELAPKRIVYISCNPQTQARDAAFLAERGWRIVEMQPVDMFPHTSHAENIILLERR